LLLSFVRYLKSHKSTPDAFRERTQRGRFGANQRTFTMMRQLTG
jgi:hypothetical protein